MHSLKILGVTVDDKLTFREHIKNISATAHRLCAITYHAFSTRQPQFLTRVFTAYIRPKLEYAAPVWSPHLKCDIAIIERVLRLFTKRIPQLRDLSYTERLSSMKLSSLTQRRQLLDISLFHKIVHGKSALKLGDFHISASQNRSLRTSGTCLHLPVAHSSLRFNFFSDRSIRQRNSIPDSIVKKNLSTIKRFMTNSI